MLHWKKHSTLMNAEPVDMWVYDYGGLRMALYTAADGGWFLFSSQMGFRESILEMPVEEAQKAATGLAEIRLRSMLTGAQEALGSVATTPNPDDKWN
jgi:hypothetical protein